MNLSQAANRVVVPRQGANKIRWAGQSGHYEVWYLTFNHRPTGQGLWLRYTMDAPVLEPAFCELWGHVFDPADPSRSFGIKERFPIARLISRGEEGVAIEDAMLGEGVARGALEGGGHKLSWDLSFSSSESSAWMAPLPMRALKAASTEQIFVSPDARYSGVVTVDGKAFTFQRELGNQSHLWGRKHSDRWSWGHCSAFEGRDDCSFDGVSGYIKKLGRPIGPLSGVFIRYRGRPYCLNNLQTMFLTKASIEFPDYKFEGTADGLTFKSHLRAPAERMLQVTYEDPDGERSYCSNTEIADMDLEVWKGDRLLDTLTARGTAHLEFGQRQPRADVRSTV
jgi:hypothetical protein